jgi:hypothetical protein
MNFIRRLDDAAGLGMGGGRLHMALRRAMG